MTYCHPLCALLLLQWTSRLTIKRSWTPQTQYGTPCKIRPPWPLWQLRHQWQLKNNQTSRTTKWQLTALAKINPAVVFPDRVAKDARNKAGNSNNLAVDPRVPALH